MNNYQKAINILMDIASHDSGITANGLLYKIAASRPSAIVNAYNDGRYDKKIIDECRSLVLAGKIEWAKEKFIKTTGLGEKTANIIIKQLTLDPEYQFQ